MNSAGEIVSGKCKFLARGKSDELDRNTLSVHFLPLNRRPWGRCARTYGPKEVLRVWLKVG